jgi:hypothetical protein
MGSKSRRYRLIEIDWPEFGVAACPPPPSMLELETRVGNLRARMEELKITHIVVYGDREHFANLTYLTGFDPRFEESLLIIGRTATPLILVGNECEAYLGFSALHNSGRLRHELFQSFSLLGQPRERSRALREILAEEGIGQTAQVGVVGYKYFSSTEHPDAAHAMWRTLFGIWGVQTKFSMPPIYLCIPVMAFVRDALPLKSHPSSTPTGKPLNQ